MFELGSLQATSGRRRDIGEETVCEVQEGVSDEYSWYLSGRAGEQNSHPRIVCLDFRPTLPIASVTDPARGLCGNHSTHKWSLHSCVSRGAVASHAEESCGKRYMGSSHGDRYRRLRFAHDPRGSETMNGLRILQRRQAAACDQSLACRQQPGRTPREYFFSSSNLSTRSTNAFK